MQPERAGQLFQGRKTGHVTHAQLCVDHSGTPIAIYACLHGNAAQSLAGYFRKIFFYCIAHVLLFDATTNKDVLVEVMRGYA